MVGFVDGSASARRETPAAGSTPNIERPTPNSQSKQRFAFGVQHFVILHFLFFLPPLGVGRWMLGVEMPSCFDAVALPMNCSSVPYSKLTLMAPSFWGFAVVENVAPIGVRLFASSDCNTPVCS